MDEPAAKPKKASKTRAPGTSKTTLRNTRLAHSGLTVEQEAYARCRAMGMSRQEAITAAGIKESLGTVNHWERPNGHLGTKLSDRINELSAIASSNAILKTGLDREWVISRLMRVAERCMQAEPVLDRKGNPTGEYQFDSMGANAALRMLGDTLGMFKHVEKKPGEEFANLTDDELARLAQELAKTTGVALNPQGDRAEAGGQQAGEVRALPQAG